jgi:Ca2+-transporting ATPase
MSHDLAVAQSAAFITLVLAQMVHIFECRGKAFSMRGNPVLLLAAATSVLITLLSVYLPFAQILFGTVAVKGVYLLPVFLGIVIGPLGTALLRKIKRLFV